MTDIIDLDAERRQRACRQEIDGQILTMGFSGRALIALTDSGLWIKEDRDSPWELLRSGKSKSNDDDRVPV